VGKADFTVIRRCRMHEFNAMIKGNGQAVGAGGAYVWPNDVLIEGCELFNNSARNTSNPVTPIDVVGGRRWIVRGNYIHDHAKGGGNNVSYAAFLKGNSRDGLFERNLVICEQLHTGQIRLGLSFGGGGSGPDKICEESTCTPEHQNGVMRNNIIVNCPADVGIYLNEAKNTKIYNNTLYNCTGIDVRFAASDADLRNNLLSGKIRDRDGGSSTKQNNLESVTASSFKAWFKDPDGSDFSLVNGVTIKNKGVNLSTVKDDFCANLRDDGTHDIGAVEYDGDGPCDTTKPYAGPTTPPKQDGGPQKQDGGGIGDGSGSDSTGVPNDALVGGEWIAGGDWPGWPDSTVSGDGGGDGEEDGCSCGLGTQEHEAPSALLLLLLVGLVALPRRRR